MFRLVVSFYEHCYLFYNIDLQLSLPQDPGTKPARRVWSSINVGTEIYVSQNGETAEWTVSDFDVLVPKGDNYYGHSSY